MDLLKDFINFDISKYVTWFFIIIAIIIGLYVIVIVSNIIKDIKFRKMCKQVDEINKKLDILLNKEGL